MTEQQKDVSYRIFFSKVFDKDDDDYEDFDYESYYNDDDFCCDECEKEVQAKRNAESNIKLICFYLLKK